MLDRVSYRFRPTTAADAQVLRVPATSGWAAAFQGRLQVDRFRLQHWGWSYRVDFYAVPLAPR